jgi:hypothetical protein
MNFSIIPVIGILTLIKHDLLIRLINSIDYKVDTVVILFQGGYNNFDFTKIKNNLIHKFIFIKSSFNIGVSRGWNYILENYLETYCIISGDDNYFIPGNLKKVCEFMTEDKLNNIMFTFNKEISFSTYIFTKKALETVGYFDENIYPAYYEDNDYHYRIRLSGNDFIQIPDVNILSGDSNRKHSHTCSSLNASAGKCFLRNEKYFKSKWNNSTSIYPFGRSDLTIKDKIQHENYFKNQNILLGHSDKTVFSKIEILTEDLIKFDYLYYKEQNEDLVRHNILNEKDLLYHYVQFGINEKRDSYKGQNYINFDWIKYVNELELTKKGIDTKEKAFIHWRIFEKKDLISFENIISIKYGIDIHKSIELKESIIKYFNTNKTAILNKNINLNDLNYDPYPNMYKYLYIIYDKNNEIKTIKYDEIRNIDIYINFKEV